MVVCTGNNISLLVEKNVSSRINVVVNKSLKKKHKPTTILPFTATTKYKYNTEHQTSLRLENFFGISSQNSK